MAKSASVCPRATENPHDQKTQIRQVSVVFSQEKSQDGKTKKPWHVQDESCGEETREGRPVF